MFVGGDGGERWDLQHPRVKACIMITVTPGHSLILSRKRCFREDSKVAVFLLLASKKYSTIFSPGCLVSRFPGGRVMFCARVLNSWESSFLPGGRDHLSSPEALQHTKMYIPVLICRTTCKHPSIYICTHRYIYSQISGMRDIAPW